MSWKLHTLRLRLRTDMHCGSLMLGFVARAFPYAPQHVPLYAAVPAAVKALGLSPVSAVFREMETLLLHAMRTTPLYVRHDDRPLFPWEPEDRELLETCFMSSRYGVALDDASRSAKESHLFETEVLLACGRGQRQRGRQQPTELEGGVWLREYETDILRLDPQAGLARKDNGTTVSWPVLLGGLTLGGDRTRNLGRLWPDAVWEPCDSLWHFGEMDLDAAWPRLRLAAGRPCPVSLAADATPGRGHFTVMTGRRFEKDCYRMDKGVVAWEPGWQPTHDVLIELAGERCARLCEPDEKNA